MPSVCAQTPIQKNQELILKQTSTLLTTFVALAATASAVTPIVVDGKDFVNSETKERFPIIGVECVPLIICPRQQANCLQLPTRRRRRLQHEKRPPK